MATIAKKESSANLKAHFQRRARRCSTRDSNARRSMRSRSHRGVSRGGGEPAVLGVDAGDSSGMRGQRCGRFQPENLEHASEFRSQRGLESEAPAGDALPKSQCMRMQKHALQAGALEAPVEIPVAVYGVSRYRMAGIGGVHANLVSASGARARLEQ